MEGVESYGYSADKVYDYLWERNVGGFEGGKVSN